MDEVEGSSKPPPPSPDPEEQEPARSEIKPSYNIMDRVILP